MREATEPRHLQGWRGKKRGAPNQTWRRNEAGENMIHHIHRAATDELCLQIYFTVETEENAMKGMEDLHELGFFFDLLSSESIWTSLLKQDTFTWDAIVEGPNNFITHWQLPRIHLWCLRVVHDWIIDQDEMGLHQKCVFCTAGLRYTHKNLLW